MMPWSTIWTVLKDVVGWLLLHRRKRCILVVEDDDMDAEMLRLRVTEMGWECDVVESAEAALPILLSRRHSVVMLDVKLPHAPGHILAEKIHKLAPWAHIVVTPGDMSDLRLFPVAVYFGVIGKPVTHGALESIFSKPKRP